MKHYSESREVDAISRVHGQIDELKDIMVKNIGEFNMCALPHFIFMIRGILSMKSFNKSIWLDELTEGTR